MSGHTPRSDEDQISDECRLSARWLLTRCESAGRLLPSTSSISPRLPLFRKHSPDGTTAANSRRPYKMTEWVWTRLGDMAAAAEGRWPQYQHVVESNEHAGWVRYIVAVFCCRMSHVRAIQWLCDNVDNDYDDDDVMMAGKLPPTPTGSPSAPRCAISPVGLLSSVNC